MAQHWKCCVSQGTGGSNPSLSANFKVKREKSKVKDAFDFSAFRGRDENTIGSRGTDIPWIFLTG